MARWRVEIIGKRLQHLGTVKAADQRRALEEAIKQFAVRPALRSKIVVTKVADGDYDETLGLSDGPPARIPLVYFRWAGPNRRST